MALMAATTAASGPLYAAFGAGAFLPMAATCGLAPAAFAAMQLRR